jgi:hypothetical protein
MILIVYFKEEPLFENQVAQFAVEFVYEHFLCCPVSFVRLQENVKLRSLKLIILTSSNQISSTLEFESSDFKV